MISPENLTIVALVIWTVTALLGANLLRRGGAYQLRSRPLPNRAPTLRRPPRAWVVLVVTHIALAMSGMAVLFVYVFVDADELIYADAGLLVIIAVAGLSAVDRWRHVPGRHAAYARGDSQFPVWSATAHAMAGTATFVLVLLTLLAELYGL